MKQKYTDISDIPLAFNPETLSQIMGISRSMAYQLANTPWFPRIRAGKRIIIEKHSFLKWLDSRVESEAV